MKFFCNAAFIKKILIIIFLTIIILLLIMGRFRTMRIRMFGKEVWGHTPSFGIAFEVKRNVPVLVKSLG